MNSLSAVFECSTVIFSSTAVVSIYHFSNASRSCDRRLVLLIERAVREWEWQKSRRNGKRVLGVAAAMEINVAGRDCGGDGKTVDGKSSWLKFVEWQCWCICEHWTGWGLTTILICVIALLFAFFIVLPLRAGASSWLTDILISVVWAVLLSI